MKENEDEKQTFPQQFIDEDNPRGEIALNEEGGSERLIKNNIPDLEA